MSAKQLSDWGRWRRAARDHGRAGNSYITHHLDLAKGKHSPKVRVMTRSAHNKIHRKKVKRIS